MTTGLVLSSALALSSAAFAATPDGAIRHKQLEVRAVAPQRVVANASGREVADFGLAAVGWLEMSGEGDYEFYVGEMTNVEGHVCNPYPKSHIRAQRLAGKAPGGGFRVPMPPDKVNTRGYFEKSPAIALPKEIGVVFPFRFVEVAKAPCSASALVQKAVNYPIDMTKSSLGSDCADLVRLYDFCKHSIRATSFCGIYVDGDRERTPYEADAYINQLCQYAIDDDYSLARKSHEWLMEHPTWPTEWKQHSVMMAWADWMWTGDKSSLEKWYDVLGTVKLDAGCKMRADGILVSPGGKGHCERDIVDWPVGERDGYVFTTVNAVVNAFRYRNLREMADIALALGKTSDARRFAEMSERLKASYNRVFLNAMTGLYVDGEGTEHSSLHANAAALAFGLAPADRRDAVADFLVKKGMACSVYFAQYFLEALYAAGRDREAMDFMLAHGDRSWLGMMDFGSTITMEAWSVKAKPNLDLNHAWGAVPLNIISRFVLGVTPAEPGFAKVRIAPRICFERTRRISKKCGHRGSAAVISFLRGVVPTRRGPVTVEIRSDELRYSSPVPAEISWPGKITEMEK